MNSGVCIFLMGRPGSGKTTIADTLLKEFSRRPRTSWHNIYYFDEASFATNPVVRDLSCKSHKPFLKTKEFEDLKSLRDRLGAIVTFLTLELHTTICSFDFPFEEDRRWLSRMLGDRLVLVHVSCPTEICKMRIKEEGRDTKSRLGRLEAIDYYNQIPKHATATVLTDHQTIDQSVDSILGILNRRNFLV